jgi:two-component sensor histidine kinase
MASPVRAGTASVPQTTTFQRFYPGTTIHVRRVRADLTAFAHGYPRSDDLVMIASELSANAVQHSRSGTPGREFTVRAQLYHGEYAWLEIEDEGGPWITGERADDHPHGLEIVTLIAGPENWGIEETSAGNRVVWVRLGWETSAPL